MLPPRVWQWHRPIAASAPQKQSRLLQPQSKRITSGGGGGEGADRIPNELTSFRYPLSLSKAGIKKMTESAHVQHCARNSEPNDFVKVSAQFTGNFSAFGRGGSARLLNPRSSWEEDGGRWHFHHAAAANLAFQDEMKW